ncbi:DUF3563 family protein [uncultured Paraburkholderia sp.]
MPRRDRVRSRGRTLRHTCDALSRRDAYLASAVDMCELERRMQSLDIDS